MDKETLLRIYASAQRSREPEVLDLAERFNRAERWALDGGEITFQLERHPDEYNSVQYFSYAPDRDEVQFVSEAVTELKCSAHTYCVRDVNTYFDNGFDDGDFGGCEGQAAMEERATLLGRQFANAVAERFSIGDGLHIDKILQERIEEIRQGILVTYPDIFLEIARERRRTR